MEEGKRKAIVTDQSIQQRVLVEALFLDHEVGLDHSFIVASRYGGFVPSHHRIDKESVTIQNDHHVTRPDWSAVTDYGV